jgi:membrane-bound lytic murein transglycosylase MltF
MAEDQRKLEQAMFQVQVWTTQANQHAKRIGQLERQLWQAKHRNETREGGPMQLNHTVNHTVTVTHRMDPEQFNAVFHFLVEMMENDPSRIEALAKTLKTANSALDAVIADVTRQVNPKPTNGENAT